MEQLKHECGVALIRLLKPLDYYQQKYGTSRYGLNKLYLLMEKQHNRGQEGAGIACVDLNAQPGSEYMFRERAEGKDAITEIFGRIESAAIVNCQLSIPNSTWVTSVIPRQDAADCSMCIPSCAVTTGGLKTSVSVATSI